MISSSSARPAGRAEQARDLVEATLGRSGCACTPTRPGSCVFGGGRRASTSWGSTTGWWSPGSGRVATGSQVAVTTGHGLDQGQGPRPDTRPSVRQPDLDVVVE